MVIDIDILALLLPGFFKNLFIYLFLGGGLTQAFRNR
jgi:hypothetical protein